MTRYAVGDIQGCYDALRRLLDTLRFDKARDELWCAGDLINRGPQNVETLRFLKSLGSRCKVVLGNHDLHYLAVERGLRRLGKKDTLNDLLMSEEREELTHWLTFQPLAHGDDDLVLVHAGLVPSWTARDALRLAKEVQSVLQNPVQRDAFLGEMYGDTPRRFNSDLTGHARYRSIVNVLTRIRFCSEAGDLHHSAKGSPLTPPSGYLPWYAHPRRRSAKSRVLFGHWAALRGEAVHPDGHREPKVHALDTGCVWGETLSALSLETLETKSVPARQSHSDG